MTISDGRVRTSRESVDRIKRLAGGLQTLGLRTGDRVAILASNSDYYHEGAPGLLVVRSSGQSGQFSLEHGGNHIRPGRFRVDGITPWTRILLPSDLPFARRVQA